jgi:hypothetical protein
MEAEGGLYVYKFTQWRESIGVGGLNLSKDDDNVGLFLLFFLSSFPHIFLHSFFDSLL